MVGTANSTLARVSPAACTRSAAENFDRMCTVPPAISAACTPPRPCWWYSGSACTSTSSACHRQAAIAARIETASWRWVSGTPLGLPVVPEVYASSAVSCGRATIPAVGLRLSGQFPDVRRRQRRGPAVPAGPQAGQPARGLGSAKASTAPESATRCPSSAAV